MKLLLCMLCCGVALPLWLSGLLLLHMLRDRGCGVSGTGLAAGEGELAPRKLPLRPQGVPQELPQTPKPAPSRAALPCLAAAAAAAVAVAAAAAAVSGGGGGGGSACRGRDRAELLVAPGLAGEALVLASACCW